MNLVYGVLRHRHYFDRLLQILCSRPPHKLEPFVYSALSVGLYQLFCLDRIPESAAVNETVKALKAAGLRKHLHGFVNGVLRAALRQRATLPGPNDPLESGRPVLNHPEWMTARWLERFGASEMERICKVNNNEPQLVLRVNTCRIDQRQLTADFNDRGIGAEPGKYAPDALILAEYQGSISNLPGYEQGYFQVQDEAAQLAVLLLGPFSEHGRYLDACAGLGGKTSYIVQLTEHHDIHIVAVEPEPHRQRLLKENMDRLFPENSLEVCNSNLQEYCRTTPLQFTGILVDAPCSGTGVTGRHPDIRWNRAPDDLPRYHREQLDILEHSADLVVPNGILVYATCSLETEENQDVIGEFLNNRPDYRLTDCGEFLPDAARIFVRDSYFCPHPTESIDGFFAARLQRVV
jgi:16S rRNA (cytosine967-C5)-methyltransferase